jgi:hypothetical protein
MIVVVAVDLVAVQRRLFRGSYVNISSKVPAFQVICDYCQQLVLFRLAYFSTTLTEVSIYTSFFCYSYNVFNNFDKMMRIA